ncbi:MAG: site-specific DNA-methyltransferase [Desulfovibrionaceae bacterium]|nr:site-specific DNA-methyltransferase [Desulfovibrionaceae bacterium]MBF0515011.1 site-specific DNA-methyltransferase [Desulfovibrionaceae bacterium]
MTDMPEKLDMASVDIAEAKRQELLRLFPEVRTEGGKLDFDRLKTTLGETVDAGKERYGMNWPGKAECFKTIQQPSLATLRPCPAESVNFDTTENLIIEGDNLEALKLLQKSYLGKVKMIYIDPPYNTGKDFIYPDNYSESLQTYLEYTGQVDSEGRKFGTNTDTDGRFHSKWLNMMYPRLYLARNMLKDDGVIFVSIDNNESTNLRELLDEIFGEENFVGIIVWHNATDNNPTNIAVEHEYIYCYSRNKWNIETEWKADYHAVKDLLLRKEVELLAKFKDIDSLQQAYSEWFKINKQFLWPLDRYKYIDLDGIYIGSQSVHNPGREGYRYDVVHPVTKKPCKQPLLGYRFPKETMDSILAEDRILFGEDESKIIELKVYAKDYRSKLASIFELDGRAGPYDLKSVFPESLKVFTNPKPQVLIREFINFVTSPSDIILDFFAGSGTTAHAVLDLNKHDNGNRQFILVQLPEPTDRKDYTTIADITKERVRRVIKKLDAEDVGKQPSLLKDAAPKQDRGFRVFKLSESNFKSWKADVAHEAGALETQLALHIDHIRPGRTQDDILYEILLKSGFPLTTPVKPLTLAGKTVFSAASGALFICLDKELTLECIRAMADLKPKRVVCLDEGFAGPDPDQLKTNAVQIFKTKGITSFKTV